MSKKSKGGMVYSTNPDWNPQSPEDQVESVPAARQDLRVWLEKNHRGGKTASVIKGFIGPVSDLEDLSKTLKAKCGTGGSVKDGEIIIQGDHRDKILQLLLQLGYRAKKAGA